MRYLALLLLVGCTDPSLIGAKVIYHDWQCVKHGSSTGVGITSSGKTAVTTSTYCRVTKCFKMEKIIHKYLDDKKRVELVDDKFCIETN